MHCSNGWVVLEVEYNSPNSDTWDTRNAHILTFDTGFNTYFATEI